MNMMSRHGITAPVDVAIAPIGTPTPMGLDCSVVLDSMLVEIMNIQVKYR